MSITKSPGQIFKELKAKGGGIELSLTLNQVSKIYLKKVSYIWSKNRSQEIDFSERTTLIEHNYTQIHLEIPTSHISFITEFVNLDSHYLIVDSTFKSNREKFELFVVILLFEGEGYPASYLYLQRNAPEGERKRAIELW
jgi:hypothetical protein